MLTSLCFRATLGVGVVFVFTVLRSSEGAEPWPYARSSSVPEQKILAALKEESRFEFIDTPLLDVLEYLRELHQVPLVIDSVGVDQRSVNPREDTVTMDLGGLTLRSALIHLLRPLGLTYSVRNDVLLITSSASPLALDLRAYNVKPLADQGVDPIELVKILEGVDGSSSVVGAKEDDGHLNRPVDPSRSVARATRSVKRAAHACRCHLTASGNLLVVRALDSQHHQIARSISTIYEASVDARLESGRDRFAPSREPPRKPRSTSSEADDPFANPLEVEEVDVEDLFPDGDDKGDDGLFGEADADAEEADDLDDPFG